MDTVHDPDPGLPRLYPTLSDEALLEAAERLRRYVSLAIRVHERLSAETPGYPQVGCLTDSENGFYDSIPKVDSGEKKSPHPS